MESGKSWRYLSARHRFTVVSGLPVLPCAVRAVKTGRIPVGIVSPSFFIIYFAPGSARPCPDWSKSGRKKDKVVDLDSI
jgi:hypothetical protein